MPYVGKREVTGVGNSVVSVGKTHPDPHKKQYYIIYLVHIGPVLKIGKWQSLSSRGTIYVLGVLKNLIFSVSLDGSFLIIMVSLI